jgi:2-dehydro-3-deoxyphosphooctonate aldolase (KDO 8-P synthase)
MARAAAAVGVTDFFFEVHPDPDNAPSDGPTWFFWINLKKS